MRRGAGGDGNLSLYSSTADEVGRSLLGEGRDARRWRPFAQENVGRASGPDADSCRPRILKISSGQSRGVWIRPHQGPFNARGLATRRVAARFSCAAPPAGRRRNRAPEDPVHARPSRVSPAGHRGPPDAARLLSDRSKRRGLRGGDPAGAREAAGVPSFLFRPSAIRRIVAPGTAYRISDLELASRLSFFLWSSIPDDELLDLAARGQAQGSDGARAAGSADASRSAFHGARQQFWRPMALLRTSAA